MVTREIIPPEHHSKGPDVRKTLAHLPRLLQFGLVLIFVVVAGLIVLFVR